MPPGSTGNVSTEDLVSMLHEMGVETGVDLPALIEASRAAQEVLGRPLGAHVLRAGPVDWHRARRVGFRPMHAKRRLPSAAEAKDFSAVEELFTEDVVFRSPVVYKPYEGRDALRVLLGAVVQVFEDFRYLDQVEDGDTAVLIFEATGRRPRAQRRRHPALRRRRPDQRADGDGPADERHERPGRGDARRLQAPAPPRP